MLEYLGEYLGEHQQRTRNNQGMNHPNNGWPCHLRRVLEITAANDWHYLRRKSSRNGNRAFRNHSHCPRRKIPRKSANRAFRNHLRCLRPKQTLEAIPIDSNHIHRNLRALRIHEVIPAGSTQQRDRYDLQILEVIPRHVLRILVIIPRDSAHHRNHPPDECQWTSSKVARLFNTKCR